MMKNKLLGIILVLGLLSIYPAWRYYANAKIFATALLDHASSLGKWSSGSINTSYDGKITIRNLSFTPTGHSQSISIENIVLSIDPMFLLKSNALELNYLLPEVLSISVNTAIINNNADDLYLDLKNNSMWMILAGYAGSFGCSRDSYLSFDDSAWENILAADQIFNLDLYYSRQTNGSLDVDLIVDAESQFSATWSSNLKPSFYDNQISLNDLIIEKLYYNYLDYGFNLKRNNACMQNYNSSFAKYRLSSAEHVQKYLRTHFAKELPELLINWYQRMLTPDVEYNAIISFNNRNYLNVLFDKDQLSVYKNSKVEIAGNDNKYIPVSLKEIDFTSIDSELLAKEKIKREALQKQAKLKKPKLTRNKYSPIIHTIGAKKSKNIPINQLNTILNKRVRIKTKKGRPITGYIRSVNNEVISIETSIKIGSAKFSLPIKQLASVELLR